jgi:hypothetical protein
VSEQFIDTVTRHAAGAVSRRTSILALGGLALAAVSAVPTSAKGNKKGKSGKDRKKNNTGTGNAVTPAPPPPTGPTGEQLAQARCASQGDQCRTFITVACQDDEGCLEAFICCDQFATCNAAAGLDCIFGPAEN